MFFIAGEDIDGEIYEFESYAKTLEDCRKECQEYLETLDGGHFDIFDADGKFIDDVEW